MEKLCEYEDYIVYRTNCSCSSRSHAIDLCVENDEGLVSIWMEGEFHYKRYSSLWARIFYRIIDAIEILFGGNIKMEAEFYFRDEEHVKEMIECIENSLKKLKKSDELKEK